MAVGAAAQTDRDRRWTIKRGRQREARLDDGDKRQIEIAVPVFATRPMSASTAIIVLPRVVTEPPAHSELGARSFDQRSIAAQGLAQLARPESIHQDAQPVLR